MKIACRKAWKVAEHNRGTAVALVLSVLATVWAVGCQAMTASPISGARLTAVQLQAEELGAYEQIKQEAERLRRQYDAAFADIDRQNQMRQIVIDWARPVAESSVGQVGVIGALLTLAGAIFDNRRKDRVIRRALNGTTGNPA